jgi:hypothetical protein
VADCHRWRSRDILLFASLRERRQTHGNHAQLRGGRRFSSFYLRGNSGS